MHWTLEIRQSQLNYLQLCKKETRHNEDNCILVRHRVKFILDSNLPSALTSIAILVFVVSLLLPVLLSPFLFLPLLPSLVVTRFVVWVREDRGATVWAPMEYVPCSLCPQRSV